MSSIPNSPLTFSTTSPSASELLRSSSSNGVPLKALGRTRLVANAVKKDFALASKFRRGKRHQYPWSKENDDNVKGGVLTHLSHFKPLKENEKPKPVTLEFEKPLIDLKKKINDVRKMANETGLDFTDQINSLENKYQQALKDLYTHLTPIQRVNIARHPNRPTFLDHVFNITDKFVEIHGDRAGYDDPAIVCGIGSIDGRSYMFMGHQKGRNTKENIKRNFGMPTPHGYRKALRMMYYADHHNFPIITFIDTPGAFADLKSEELGQGEAIAHNLRTMFGLKVPIVSIVIGEGGSGGALAIGCGNKLLMLENAVFYVASPEACAAILYKTAKESPKAAEKLKITATELCKLKIADGVIPEPLGGAHADPAWTSQQIKIAITEAMDELLQMDTQTLLAHRYQKFRQIGGSGEPVLKTKKLKPKGVPSKTIDIELKRGKPKGVLSKTPTPKSRSVKPEEVLGKTPNLEKKVKMVLRKTENSKLKDEIEQLKLKIKEAKESSSKPPEGVDEMIEKLKEEIWAEYLVAVLSMGLKDKLKALREEYAKAESSSTLSDPAQKDRISKLTEEFEQGLSKAPNFASLKYRQVMLRKISKAKEALSKTPTLKSRRAKGVLGQTPKRVLRRTPDPKLKDEIEQLKQKIQEAKESSSKPPEGVDQMIAKLKREITVEFLFAVKSMGLRDRIKALREESARARSSSTQPDPALNDKINKLAEELEQGLSKAPNSASLKYRQDMLKEISTAKTLLEQNENGSLKETGSLNENGSLKEGGSLNENGSLKDGLEYQEEEVKIKTDASQF